MADDVKTDSRTMGDPLFALLFTDILIPTEIGTVVPVPAGVEVAVDPQRPWYFGKREGTSADERLFAGDVRVSPLLKWREDRTEALHNVANEVRAALADPQRRPTPLMRLSMQWDVLSVWWRLEQTEGTPPEVLEELAKLVVDLAQPAEVLNSLPSGYDLAQAQFAGSPMGTYKSPWFSPDDVVGEQAGWKQLARRSSKLFVAPHSMRASRVYMKALEPVETQADTEAFLKSWATSGLNRDWQPDRQVQTAMVLSLIGVTPELEAVATPVVDEIRFRVVHAPHDGIPPEETTSRDGSSIWLYYLSRAETQNQGQPAYRFVPGLEESLFPEYGTAKQTTFAAQCTLCHRIENSGRQSPGGIRSVSSYAGGEITTDKLHRFRLAEAEMKVVTTRLKDRLAAGAKPLPLAEFDYKKTTKGL
ncbi:MAG: hypothetical protein C0478_09615 [Planctomyces sp.]|nr:hypothetical protein [Planctomyces sp.]